MESNILILSYAVKLFGPQSIPWRVTLNAFFDGSPLCWRPLYWIFWDGKPLYWSCRGGTSGDNRGSRVSKWILCATQRFSQNDLWKFRYLINSFYFLILILIFTNSCRVGKAHEYCEQQSFSKWPWNTEQQSIFKMHLKMSRLCSMFFEISLLCCIFLGRQENKARVIELSGLLATRAITGSHPVPPSSVQNCLLR